MEESSIRKPAVAGAFYPDDPATLRRDIRRYLDLASPAISPERTIGLISPHAGYLYSGGVAAFGYKLLMGKKYKRVVVFALSHRVGFRGASVFQGEAYQTPLGLIPIDTDLVKRLRKISPLFSCTPMAHQVEHSLEVQLPFLQEVLDDFLLVPILLREQSLELCRKVVNALLEALPEDAASDTLVVGSTDLYHGPDYEECRSLDQLLAETIRSFDVEDFARRESRGDFMACGASSIMAAMLLSKAFGAQKLDVLKLTNSADVTGTRTDYVVGYLSAVLY